MALQLETKYKGVTANYWRINDFNHNDITDKAIVSLWLYLNEASKDESLENTLTRQVVTIDNISSILIPDDLSAIKNARDLLKTMIYDKIKTLPEWAEAIDC